MQEIALFLSSLAGIATAAAVRKMPKNKTQLLSLGASSQIKSQINSLKIEKDILTKTISRLYQADTEYSKIQRDKLLLKYQHQLGIVLAKLEKLEQASQHPDLGPVGDGLITLMDQKLARLDDRLYELSSKIQTKNEAEKTEQIREKHSEKKRKEKTSTFVFNRPKTSDEPIVIPPSKTKQSFEITTLTRLPKEPKFPLFEQKQVSSKEDIIDKIAQPKPKIDDKAEIIQSSIHITEPKPDLTKEVKKITEHKALPEPTQKKPSSNMEDDIEEDDDDLDKIKGDIMRVLSKLEQAEVE